MKNTEYKILPSLFIIGLMLITSIVFSQTGIRNNGAKITIASGVLIGISGSNADYTNTTLDGEHGRIDLSGKFYINGDWKNNAIGGDLLDGTTGSVIFDGNTAQYIGGSRITNFVNVKLNENVEIGTSIKIATNLNLSDGSLILGDNDIELASNATITNYGLNKYIITGGDGSLVQDIVAGGSSVTYPIGTGSSYLPVIIEQAAGASSGKFYVRIIKGVWDNGTSGSDISKTSASCVDKTCLIESTVGSIDINITMQWNALDEKNGFDRENCYISHHKNGKWDIANLESASGTGPYSVSRSGITSLSPFAVSGENNGGALPIHLLEFTATANNNNAILNWTTASEINNAGFEILRSFNGCDFLKIGFVHGNGNSNEIKKYEFFDESPIGNNRGVIYYKLKQIDFDGKFGFSNIQYLVFNGSMDNKIVIWPNPSSGILNIDFRNRTISWVRIIDISGKTVFTKENDIFNKIDINFLNKGLYFIELSDGREIYRKKFLLK